MKFDPAATQGPRLIPSGKLRIRSSIAKLEIGDHMVAMTESKRLPRPRDPNQLAKLIADIATGEVQDKMVTEDGRDLAAVLLGRRGGLRGGVARKNALSAERRTEIAQIAARARWGIHGKDAE